MDFPLFLRLFPQGKKMRKCLAFPRPSSYTNVCGSTALRPDPRGCCPTMQAKGMISPLLPGFGQYHMRLNPESADGTRGCFSGEARHGTSPMPDSLRCFMKEEKLNLSLLCDFYELTMGNGYLKAGYQDRVTYFDIFFRDVPDNGGFAICAGLDQFINYVENLHFSEGDID